MLVFCADPFTWEGRYGRPARRGAAVHCLEPEDFEAGAVPGRGAGTSHCPRTQSRTRPSSCRVPRSTGPSGPEPGTACIPSSTATAAGSPAASTCRCCGTLVHVTVERLPDGRDPHRAMRL